MYKPPYRSPASGGWGGLNNNPAKQAYQIASNIVIALEADRRILRNASIQVKGTQQEVDLGEKVLEMVRKSEATLMEIDLLKDTIESTSINPEYRGLFESALDRCYNRAAARQQRGNPQKIEGNDWLSAGLSDEEATLANKTQGGAFKYQG